MDATENQAHFPADETRDHMPDDAAIGIHDMDISEVRQRINDGTLTGEQREELANTMGEVLERLRPVTEPTTSTFAEHASETLAEQLEPAINPVMEVFREQTFPTITALFEQSEFARILQGVQEAARAAEVAVVHECVAEGARDRVLNGKGNMIERLRNAPSVFADNPDACARFKEWCETNEHTTKNSKVSYKKLAECIQATPQTASKYYKHPEKIKALFAKILFEFVGEQTEYDMMHGWGAYDADAVEAQKGENIDRICELLEDMEPNMVEFWLKAIGGEGGAPGPSIT